MKNKNHGIYAEGASWENTNEKYEMKKQPSQEIALPLVRYGTSICAWCFVFVLRLYLHVDLVLGVSSWYFEYYNVFWYANTTTPTTLFHIFMHTEHIYG